MVDPRRQLTVRAIAERFGVTPAEVYEFIEDLFHDRKWSLTVHRIADEFGVRTTAVYHWIKSKQLAALRLPGGDYRIRREDLDVFVATHYQAVGEPCHDQSNDNPPIDSGSAENTGSSAGPSPRPARPSPYQRGKVIPIGRRSGATSS